MPPPSERPAPETVFRLNRAILYPLALLLAMPLTAVILGFASRGLVTRNLWSAVLTLIIALLFLPWLTRRVAVSPRGITAGTIFSRRHLAWGEVERVSGFVFRGRAIILLEGKGIRLAITDVVGNFRHLVGYIVEHASRAAIGEGVAPLVMVRGRPGEVAILWLAVAAMLVMMFIKYLP